VSKPLVDDIRMFVALCPLYHNLGANFNSGAGAAYGTAKSGIGIAGVGTYRPDLIMKVALRTLLLRSSVDPLRSHSYPSSCPAF
jgi:hypothetical protein